MDRMVSKKLVLMVALGGASLGGTRSGQDPNKDSSSPVGPGGHHHGSSFIHGGGGSFGRAATSILVRRCCTAPSIADRIILALALREAVAIRHP